MAKFTRQAILASFLKLLGEKPLDQITVKDLVDDCGINRKTFYYYFQDIYALADEVFRTRIEQLRVELPPETHTPREIVRVLTEYLYENRKITLHVFRTLGYEKMEKFLDDTCMEYLPAFIRQAATEFTISDADLTALAACASVILSGLLTRWIRDGMQTIPAETVAQITDLMKGVSRLALENADRRSREARGEVQGEARGSSPR